MPLNKDVLGLALYNRAKVLNDVDISVEALDQARKDFWLAIAEEVIEHFKASGEIKVLGTGLTAGPYTVTGESIAKIE